MTTVARFALLRRLALGAAFVCLLPAAAFAQQGADAPNWLERRVEGVERGLGFFGGREERPVAPRSVQQAQSSSLADIAVRLDRLENQMRQLNGRLDEIQYQGRKNDEALKRFQGDVDFRFQDIEGKGGGAKPARRGDAGGDMGGAGSTASAGPRDGGGVGAPPANLGGGRSSPGGGNDTIGGLIDEGDDPNAPMNIRPPSAGRSTGGDRVAARVDGGGVTAGGGSSRDQFDLGVGFVQRRDYGQAEATFREFLRTYPKDAKAPEARYWLGESLYQRKKFADAADSFLTIYQEAPSSAKAPESMLKLGMSLNGMGKKDEACATIAEAGRKYARIKAQSDRELKRLAC